MNFNLKAVVTAMGLGLALSASMAQAATTTVNGGTIKFEGDVVNAACAIDSSSTKQTVQMGQVRVADLKKDTEASTRIPFTIQLENCDTTVSTTAATYFTGTAASGYTNALQAGEGTDAASGVGIRMYDQASKVVTLNTPATTTTAQTLVDGSNTLSFNAVYVGVADTITAGNGDATATFNMVYN